ncbi:MAG: hypothetical protein M1812_000123 [Candelaria pacifica]|nr:MAG: hypothetical protein M1812_000123 [Candelaria pacifica]
MGHTKLRLCAAFTGLGVQASRRSPRAIPGKSARRSLLDLGYSRSSSTTQSLPRVAQPTLWHSLVPSFLRRSVRLDKSSQSRRSKEWNPATFYIVIFLLIGSQAIQMIALRNEFLNFSRKADAKIGLLKEVIERVQSGEEVDVEGLLGTGDREKEKEWEEGMDPQLHLKRDEEFLPGAIQTFEQSLILLYLVLREIEHEDALWQSGSQKRKAKRSTGKDVGTDIKERSKSEDEPAFDSKSIDATSAPTTHGPPGFY